MSETSKREDPTRERIKMLDFRNLTEREARAVIGGGEQELTDPLGAHNAK